MGRRLGILTSLVILASTILVGAAHAQPGEAVAEFIARTGEIVAWAQDQVRESTSPQAHRVLAEAQALHAQSLQQEASGRPRLALAASRRARAAAQQAASLARESRGFEERARLRIERYGEFHDQLLDRAREANDQLALRFIDESEQQAARARDQFRQGNFEMALNLIEPAEGLLTRAARLLFEGGGAPRLERELARADALIERAADTEGSQPDLLQSARAALARARELAAQGQVLRALQSCRLAVRLAAEATAAAGEGLSADAVRAQLERWDQRHEAVAEAVAAADAQEAARVLERARHHRHEAERLLVGGSLEPSLRQIKAAFDLLNEAGELVR